MPWYAIRSVYHFGVKSKGINVFEERVVCFEAQSTEIARRLADEETDQYATINNFECHPEQSGYELDPIDLVHGHEIWSELFESNESLIEFYRNRYQKYLYSPE